MSEVLPSTTEPSVCLNYRAARNHAYMQTTTATGERGTAHDNPLTHIRYFSKGHIMY